MLGSLLSLELPADLELEPAAVLLVEQTDVQHGDGGRTLHVAWVGHDRGRTHG